MSKSPEVSPQASSYKESPSRELAHTEDFKNFIRENPGAIKNFLKAKDRLVNEGDKIDEQEMKIELILQKGEGNPVKIYKVRLGGKTFAIKLEDRDLTGPTPYGGYREFHAAEEAREKLSHIEGIEIVDFGLGYSDDHRDYFVSEWKELPILEDYVKDLKRERKNQKIASLEKRLRAIKSALGREFLDVYPHNIFYDSPGDKLILYDINRRL